MILMLRLLGKHQCDPRRWCRLLHRRTHPHWVDDCGNESTAVQTITVFDDVMPTITGDIEIEIECSEYPDNNYVGWSDNCSDSADVGDIHGHERLRRMCSACGHVHAFVHGNG